MVCVYCGGPTRVTNSRHQKRSGGIWRRRGCATCNVTFSSLEQADYDRLLAVQAATSYIVPFQRDILFLSLYDACRHREAAVADATALTDTVLGKLLSLRRAKGLLNREDIIEAVTTALKHFDNVALVHYTAFHPRKDTETKRQAIS